jgi:pSer/pThr/pTyr-binding forkhead associated (FHA) protein
MFIRDTKSSSGTFLNHIRICPPNQLSQPHEIKDGDIVQLGVDYQGGVEEIYRSVKMRFEVNPTRRQRPLSFNLTAFQHLRQLTAPPPASAAIKDVMVNSSSNGDSSAAGTAAPTSAVIMDQTGMDPTTLSSEHLTATHNSNSNSSSNNNNNSPLSTPGELEECCICL